jgi:hypothetical protein
MLTSPGALILIARNVEAPEVVREVGVHDFRVAAEQLLFQFDHRLLRVAARPGPPSSCACFPMVLGLRCSWCPESAPMPSILGLHVLPPTAKATPPNL